MDRLGELAAFGTAVCWTASAIFFEGASRRLGALAVNLYKVLGATLLLCLAGGALRGMPLPLDAPRQAWIFLPISGLIGFVVADFFLFNAYILIGSRVTVIFSALTPLFTTLFGYLILGERMRGERLAAMLVVVTGISIVVGSRAGRRGSGTKARSADMLKGYSYAFLQAIFQALGLVVSKLGLGGYDAVSGTQIRTLAAFAGFALQALILGKAREIFGAVRDPWAFKRAAVGTVFGPFLGVVLSLFALQRADAGVASTLMALTPVLIIPPSILILGQKVRALDVLGAAVAVAGAALFFVI